MCFLTNTHSKIYYLFYNYMYIYNDMHCLFCTSGGYCPSVACYNGGTCTSGNCVCPGHCMGDYCTDCHFIPAVEAPVVTFTVNSVEFEAASYEGWIVSNNLLPVIPYGSRVGFHSLYLSIIFGSVYDRCMYCD